MINEMEKIMTIIEPDWEKSPAWAGWWALDREGDAYWWEHQPFYNKANGWWLCPLSDEECYCNDIIACVEFDHNWPPKEFDRNQIIDWEKTLRSRP